MAPFETAVNLPESAIAATEGGLEPSMAKMG